RAQEATDKDTRALFLKFRDSWLSAAKRYESASAAAAEESAERHPSFASTPRARDWRESPNDARTDTTAERLGGGRPCTRSQPGGSVWISRLHLPIILARLK